MKNIIAARILYILYLTICYAVENTNAFNQDVSRRLCELTNSNRINLNEELRNELPYGSTFTNATNLFSVGGKYMAARFFPTQSENRIYDLKTDGFKDFRLWNKILDLEVYIDISNNEGNLSSICGHDNYTVAKLIDLTSGSKIEEFCYNYNNLNFVYNPKDNLKRNFRLYQSMKTVLLVDEVYKSFDIARRIPVWYINYVTKIVFSHDGFLSKPYIDLVVADCTNLITTNPTVDTLPDHTKLFGKTLYHFGRYLCSTIKHPGIYNIANRVLSTTTFYENIFLYPINGTNGKNVVAKYVGNMTLYETESHQHLDLFSTVMWSQFERLLNIWAFDVNPGSSGMFGLNMNYFHSTGEECYVSVYDMTNKTIRTLHVGHNEKVRIFQANQFVEVFKSSVAQRPVQIILRNHFLYNMKCSKTYANSNPFSLTDNAMLELWRLVLSC